MQTTFTFNITSYLNEGVNRTELSLKLVFPSLRLSQEVLWIPSFSAFFLFPAKT